MKTFQIRPKTISLTVLLLAALVSPRVKADVIYNQTFTTGFANGGVIPDYNPVNPVGWQDSQTISSLGGYSISSVEVTLNISGGWSGDLYGYLRHDDGNGTGFVVLLDRPGYSGSGDGYGNPGFNITLSDTGDFTLENYQDHSPSYNGSGQLTGTWQAHSGSMNLAFENTAPNGTWTLFLQDFAAGDQSQLVSWGLRLEGLTPVPEPTTWAGIIFAALFGGVQFARGMSRRGR